jgi:hypothetical protein
MLHCWPSSCCLRVLLLIIAVVVWLHGVCAVVKVVEAEHVRQRQELV